MGATREVAGSRSSADEWSDWQPLRGAGTTSPAVLAETLDGGQSFRWHRTPAGTWQGVWGENVVQLRLDDQGVLAWRSLHTMAKRMEPALRRYLGLDQPFSTFTDALPWRSDAHLARCIEAFPGLRLLRQAFGETLLCFLCSATKQIVQIKQMVALLALRHGRRIASYREAEEATAPVLHVHSLPSWQELAHISEADLRACLLGFRARYIAETARYLAAHAGWLAETEAAPYTVAKERLCSLPGVGEKVADCVLLFGAGRLEAFPVDVWILKTMARRYDLEGWKPAQLTRFGQVHFGAYAGLAQQYLFAWERRMGSRVES